MIRLNPVVNRIHTYKNLFPPTSGIYISTLPPGASRHDVSLVVVSGLPRSLHTFLGVFE